MKTRLLAPLLLFAAVLAASAPVELPVRWSAHYAFEEIGDKAPDVSSSSVKGEAKHDARNHGAKSVEGHHGKGIRLDGKSWLAIEGFRGGRGFAVAAWIRTSHSGQAQYIVSKGNNYEGSFYLRLQKDGRPRTAMLPVDNLNAIVVEGDYPVNDGKWHHVAGMMDGRELTLYVDGRLAGSLPFSMGRTVTLPEYKRLTWIGSFDIPEDDGEPNAAFFVGDMDEIRLLDGPVSRETLASWAQRR